MNLSAIAITKNAAGTLARTLASLQFADEIIVVDSGSTDATLEIARKFGAKFFANPWPGYGRQKNFGLSKAAGDWVLFIDADEEVSPQLREEILSVVNPRQLGGRLSQQSFYWLRIVTVFLGKPLRHLYGHNPRLFEKSAGRWTDDKVHEQVATNSGQRVTLGDTNSEIIKEPLLHYSQETVAAYLEKMHRYTTLDAQQIATTGKHRSGWPVKKSWWLPWQLGARQFLKLYFYRRGFLDGLAGFRWCVLSAYYEYEMARKFLAL